MRSPVTQADWSEARNSATRAISSGRPSRPMGSVKPNAFADFGAETRACKAFGLGHTRRDGIDADSSVGQLDGEFARDRVDRAL